MKNLKGKYIVIIVLSIFAIAITINLSRILYYFTFHSTFFLPKGELVEKIDSPDKSYTAMIYRVNQDGLRVDVKRSFFRKKIIYWSWREADINVSWVDDYTISINDRILDVTKDVYDKRTAPD